MEQLKPTPIPPRPVPDPVGPKYVQRWDKPVSAGVKLLLDQDGKKHSTTHPAFVAPNGLEVWYRHGKHHRVGGPAITWPNGSKFWWENGVFIRSELAVKT